MSVLEQGVAGTAQGTVARVKFKLHAKDGSGQLCNTFVRVEFHGSAKPDDVVVSVCPTRLTSLTLQSDSCPVGLLCEENVPSLGSTEREQDPNG